MHFQQCHDYYVCEHIFLVQFASISLAGGQKLITISQATIPMIEPHRWSYCICKRNIREAFGSPIRNCTSKDAGHCKKQRELGNGVREKKADMGTVGVFPPTWERARLKRAFTRRELPSPLVGTALPRQYAGKASSPDHHCYCLIVVSLSNPHVRGDCYAWTMSSGLQ
jgi:hypothetical protein